MKWSSSYLDNIILNQLKLNSKRAPFYEIRPFQSRKDFQVHQQKHFQQLLYLCQRVNDSSKRTVWPFGHKWPFGYKWPTGYVSIIDPNLSAFRNVSIV